MTDWREDLQHLLEETGSNIASSGVGQGVGGALMSAPATAIFNALDLPASIARGTIGSAINLAQGEGLHGIEQGQQQWNETIGGLRGADLGPFGFAKMPIEIAANIAVDPLTYTGVGLAGKAAKNLGMAARATAEAGRPFASAALRTAAAPLYAAQFYNDAPRKLLEGASVGSRQFPGLQGGVRQLGRGIERVSPGLLKPSATSLRRTESDQLRNIASKLSSSPGPLAAWTPPIQTTTPSGAVVDDIAALNIPEWPDNATGYGGLGFDARLTLEENELLQTPLATGQTYRDFISKEAAEADLAISALRANNISWPAYASPEQRLEAVGDNPKLREIVTEWNKREVDLLAARDGNEVAVHLLDDMVDRESGIKHARPTHYDMFKAVWTEQALTSIKYHTGNLLGGWTQNALSGVYTNPASIPRDVWQSFKAIRAGSDQVGKQQAIASLKGDEIARSWGLPGMPVEVFRGGVRALNMSDTDFGPSAIGSAVGRLTRSETLGRKAGWLFAANNDMALAIDTAVRSPVWGQSLDDAMWEMMPAWEGEVRKRGSKIAGFDFNVRDGINAPPSFQPDDLKQHLMGLGFQDGEAKHLVNQFVEIQGIGLKKARAELGRVQFYLEKTKLDEIVGKVVPFHYYPSRALRFYGEEAVRNPYLVLNYMRLADGMEDSLNDPGLSARQKGFIRIMGTPLGFSLLMNPDALFGMVKVFGLQDEYDPDGQTGLGGALDWMKMRGVGLYPWIDGTINMMGIYGNTFEPDLLGIRHKALVGGAVQFVRAHLGLEPAGAPYAAAMGQARYATSAFVSDILPWLSEPVTPRAGGSSQEAALDTIIESVIVEANPGLTNQELLDIMSDPESPEYESAYRTVADAGITTQLLNFTAPVKFTMRHDARDVTQAQVEVVQQEADRLGVPPWEVAPTQDDLAFQAQYKALTGNEYKPGDYESASLKHDLIRAPTEAKALIIADAEYNVIGSPKQRRHYENYMALLDGTDSETKNLSDAGRQEVANQYLDRNRGAGKAVDEIRAMRQTYVANHAEFAEFKDWQGKMYDLSEQLGGNLAEYRRQASQQNPNAARYFQDKIAHLNETVADEEERKKRLEQATASAAAFQAITGKATLRSIPGPFPNTPPADVTLPNMLPAGVPQGYSGNAMSRELARIGMNAGLNTML